MKQKHTSIRIGIASLLLGLALSATTASAQHIHAGAFSTAQDSQLYFTDGASFINTSGYVKTLPFASTGTFAGLYNGGLTFVAASSDPMRGSDYSPNHAALGSFLELRLETVISGPDGGEFAFWQSGVQQTSLGVGDTGTFQLDLSDAANGAGMPLNDPYGHLHGQRRWTATERGVYDVGFRIVDTSVNGVGGGPIHTPSDLFVIRFEAVPEPGTTALIGVGALGAAVMAWRRRKA
ncbi:MAG: PEP-CTERM sorting domain-containing protein [Verrucomicrobiae bacterium]|nr:PEP-CTERM sorting domain-containing protein [Verrucomicrobiae bacterium]